MTAQTTTATTSQTERNLSNINNNKGKTEMENEGKSSADDLENLEKKRKLKIIKRNFTCGQQALTHTHIYPYMYDERSKPYTCTIAPCWPK